MEAERASLQTLLSDLRVERASEVLRKEEEHAELLRRKEQEHAELAHRSGIVSGESVSTYPTAVLKTNLFF